MGVGEEVITEANWSGLDVITANDICKHDCLCALYQYNAGHTLTFQPQIVVHTSISGSGIEGNGLTSIISELAIMDK